MPTTTPSGATRVPSPGDAPDVPGDLLRAAEDLEAYALTQATKGRPRLLAASSGTAQALPAGAVTALTGGGSGWTAPTNFGSTDMQINTGVTAWPITLLTAGQYIVQVTVAHSAVCNGRAFYELLTSPGDANNGGRAVWAYDDGVVNTYMVSTGAGGVKLGLQDFAAAANTVTTAKLRVYRVGNLW